MEPRVAKDNRRRKVVDKAKNEIKVKVVDMSSDGKDDLVAARQVTASQRVDTILLFHQPPQSRSAKGPPKQGHPPPALAARYLQAQGHRPPDPPAHGHHPAAPPAHRHLHTAHPLVDSTKTQTAGIKKVLRKS